MNPTNLNAELDAIINRVNDEWATRRGAELETGQRVVDWTWERSHCEAAPALYLHPRQVEIAWLDELPGGGYRVMDLEVIPMCSASTETEARRALRTYGVKSPACIVETKHAWQAEVWL